MSIDASTSLSSDAAPTVLGFPRRLAERSRLLRRERANELLVELHSARALVTDAARVVAAGWVQRAWFAYRDEQGRERFVGAHDLHRITGRQPTAACLVGAVVHAAGGLPAARTERVHRALNLTWQAWSGGSAEPIGFWPSPVTRLARVRDLTAWNDQPQRRAEDVTALLDAASQVAARQLAGMSHRRQGSRCSTDVVDEVDRDDQLQLAGL
ncbi:MAG TPA: hypothetical protein VF557_00250 [Jatrophihabitans sp.]|jgi:hypothetical protein|uniref:DUF6197 family protein n=1 Tax=Jatrophihabitans sp. TaxID=1932789 RepID=UPI002EEDCCFE